MTSAKKMAANRANARKSRGPNSKAGKRTVSRNALRHGLSAISHRNPVIVGEIEQMAKAICGDDTNPLLFDQAMVIAENEILLRSVRMQKIAVIERLQDPWLCSLAGGPWRFLAMARRRSRQTTIAFDEFSQLAAKLLKQGEKFLAIFGPREVKPDEPVVRYKAPKDRDEHEALLEALPDLARLLRYERRAWSRRRRALYKFLAVKLTSRTRLAAR